MLAFASLLFWLFALCGHSAVNACSPSFPEPYFVGFLPRDDGGAVGDAAETVAVFRVWQDQYSRKDYEFVIPAAGGGDPHFDGRWRGDEEELVRGGGTLSGAAGTVLSGDVRACIGGPCEWQGPCRSCVVRSWWTRHVPYSWDAVGQADTCW